MDALFSIGQNVGVSHPEYGDWSGEILEQNFTGTYWDYLVSNSPLVPEMNMPPWVREEFINAM